LEKVFAASDPAVQIANHDDLVLSCRVSVEQLQTQRHIVIWPQVQAG
jgi:hypothetical protein